MVLLRILLGFLFCAMPLIECAAPAPAPAPREEAPADAAPAVARKPRVRREKVFDQYPDEMINGPRDPECDPTAFDVFCDLVGEYAPGVLEKGYDFAVREAAIAEEGLERVHLLYPKAERSKLQALASARTKIYMRWVTERKHLEDDFYAEVLKESKEPLGRGMLGGIVLPAEKQKELAKKLEAHDEKVDSLMQVMSKRPPSFFRGKSVEDAYASIAPEAEKIARKKAEEDRIALEARLRSEAHKAHKTERKWLGFGPLVLTAAAEEAIQKELKARDESTELFLDRVLFREEIPASASTPPPAVDTTAAKTPAAPQPQGATAPVPAPVPTATDPAAASDASPRSDDGRQSPGRKGSPKKKKASTPVAQAQQPASPSSKPEVLKKPDAFNWKRYVTIGSGTVAIPIMVYLALLQIEWKNYQEDLRTGFNEEPIPFGVYLRKRFLSFNAKSLNDWLCKVVLPVACATGGWYLTNGNSVPVVSAKTAPAA